MKISVYEMVEVEAEVSIGVEQITEALAEALRLAKDEEAGYRALVGPLTAVVQVLQAFDESMIEKIKPAHRDLVTGHLEELAAKMRAGVVEVTTDARG